MLTAEGAGAKDNMPRRQAASYSASYPSQHIQCCQHLAQVDIDKLMCTAVVLCVQGAQGGDGGC